ncbi:MAG: hypothetical protein II596_04860, partial [Thermoguttaceae bacterium]|nr:hypothetical protein [Thermoguttaceae bacterium]
EILDIPAYGCINIHGSLLPKYRGAAPIQRSVLAGDPESGVTIMYMAEECDAGDMLVFFVLDANERLGKSSFFHDDFCRRGRDTFAGLNVDIDPNITGKTV